MLKSGTVSSMNCYMRWPGCSLLGYALCAAITPPNCRVHERNREREREGSRPFSIAIWGLNLWINEMPLFFSVVNKSQRCIESST